MVRRACLLKYVGLIDVADACNDKQNDDQDLYKHDNRIEAGRFLDAADQQQRYANRDQGAGNVYDPVHYRPVCKLYLVPRAFTQCQWEVYSQCVPEEADNITRPTNRNRRGAKCVFEDQVPADDPGDEFAERSEEHTSELQSRFGISYAVFCL